MNSTTDARGALRDLFQFHYTSQAWLPALFVLVAVGALVVLLAEILYVRPGHDYVPVDFQLRIALLAILCWLVTVFSAYAGGFIMGRLHVPRA
jgi:H+/Cl- antiporter ClcA